MLIFQSHISKKCWGFKRAKRWALSFRVLYIYHCGEKGGKCIEVIKESIEDI
jgi:hypothetical protein